jgi:hypothetical protein
MSPSSDGRHRRGVTPDEQSSFQNRLLGCAYACPDRAVSIPGFSPMKSTSRFGPIASGRPGRYAYVLGGA